MVEIIKRGQLPEDETAIVTCSNCQSELRLKKGEAKWTHCQRDGSFGEIQCPVCNNRVIVYPKQFKRNSSR